MWTDISTFLQRDSEQKPVYFITSILDISDRKLAEEKLKDSHALLRIAGEMAKLGGWNVKLKENRSYWSDEVAAIHGMPAGFAPIVEDGINFYAPEWRDKITKVFTDCAQKGIPYNEEMEIITSSGKRVWIQTLGEAVKDENGIITKVQGAFQDISERKKSEAALIESERFLRESQAVAHLGTYAWNLSTGFWKSSKILDEIFGIDESYMRSLEGWTNIIHPDWQEIMNNYVVYDVLEKHQRFDKEYLIIRQNDGQPIWVHGQGELEMDIHGKPLNLFGTISDISARKKAEETLRETNEYLENLFSSANSPIIVWDASLKITRFNKAFEKLSGYKASEVIGKKVVILFPENKVKSFLELIVNTSIGTRWETVEIEILRKDGEVRHVLWNSANILDNTQTKITATIAQGNDITERKKAEIMLRIEKERLRTILDMVGDPIFLKDNDHRITNANRAFYDIFGMDENNVIGYTLAEAVPENEMQAFLQVDRKVLDTGITDIREEKLTVRAFTHTLITRKSRFIDETGKRFLVGSIHDITERKLVEESVLQEKKFNQAAIDSLPGLFYLFDEQGHYLRWNKNYEEVSGYSAEEIAGMSPYDYFTEPDKSNIAKAIQQVWTTGNVAVEGKFKTKNHIQKQYLFTGQLFWFEGKRCLIGMGIDITERKKAEEELKISEERYRSLLTNLEAGVVVHSPDTSIIMNNKRAAELLGLSDGQLQGRLAIDPQWKFIYENNIPLRHEEYPVNRILETKMTFTGLILGAFRPVTNDIAWFIVNGFPDFDGNGNISEILISFIDITQRKQAEETLARSEEKFRRLFESTPLPIFYVNKEGTIVLRNERFTKVFGYTETETPSLTEWWQKAYPDIEYRNWVMPNWEAAVKKASKKGTDIESQAYHVTCKDGSVREIIISGTVIHDNFLATFIDITERKQAEEALSRYTKRLQNLHRIDQIIIQAIESPEAIVQNALHHIRGLLQCQRASVGIFDFENKEVQVFAADVDGKTIVQVGLSMDEEMYGVVDILRQSRLEIVEDMSKVASPSKINKVLQAEGIQSSINVALVSAQAMYGVLNIGWEFPRTINQEESDIVSEVAGQITIAIEQAHLLKKTKNYADELEQRVIQRTEQLQLANKELEAFSYSVSHDLRAPLRHISGFITLFLENRTSQLTSEEIEYLDVVVHSSEEMGKLIDALLSFSRLNRSELIKEHIITSEIITRVLKLFKQEIQSRSIRIDVSKLPDTMADPQLINQVWTNLISNAIKYTGKKEIAIIEIGGYVENNETVFYIKDNGAGFNMKYADKLFTVFQRLHKPRDFEGIGIGLANIHRIVSRHGGRCWADGLVNSGATFYFSLPE